MRGRLKLVVIIASRRENRYGDKVGRWFAEQARISPHFDVEVVDIAEVDLPSIHETNLSPAMMILSQTLWTGDAFVVVTPEYNTAIPAI